jgi:glutamyl-tRNA synthetase
MPLVRTRFAPSPTGHLHIGGARTALFNFLYARHHGGVFVLRIEDTDRERSTPESTRAILDDLTWLGLAWDEGPFYQSQRAAFYQERVAVMLERGLAYRCTCTPETLEAKRQAALTARRKPMYDGTCRDRGLGAGGPVPFAVRFRAPRNGETVIEDLVKGRVVFRNAELDDLVIVRSDGTPTYNLCAVLDDAAMGITHVIRGDDHLANTPRQVLLYRALGYPVPHFAHVPLILGTDRARLSKRHGAMSVTAYRDAGYLPEAVVNYLARLGWGYGDQEIFSVAELIAAFAVEDVGKAAGIFNPEKLLWVNAHYIKGRDPMRLAAEIRPFVAAAGYGQPSDPEWLARVVAALKPRARTLVELVAHAGFFLTDDVAPDPAAAAGFLTPAAAPALGALVAELERLADWQCDTIREAFERVRGAHGLALGKLAQPVRVAVTGTTASPGIFEVLELLGRRRSLARLRAAIEQTRPAAPA